MKDDRVAVGLGACNGHENSFSLTYILTSQYAIFSPVDVDVSLCL